MQKESGGSILKFAILSLAFGSTFILSFLGIIFASISRAKMRDYVLRYGELDAPGKGGKGIGIAGTVVSWVMTGILILYVVVIIALLGTM